MDLSAIVRRIGAELRLANPGREVEFIVANGVSANGDQQLLSILLENLLGNAWKFTARRKVARIEFGIAPQPDGSDAYFVRDNGAGFDIARAERLFGPFQRLHSQADFPGIGIGLATVRRVVHRHGGRAWATSVKDEGATFSFTLGMPWMSIEETAGIARASVVTDETI